MKKSNPSIPIASDSKNEKVSAVVKFEGKALFHINSLQGKYYSKYHKCLSKSDATNLLLESIPGQIVRKAIEKIMSRTN